MRFMVTQPVENQPHYLRGYAKEGDEEWVRRLLDDGVDVNDQDEHGMTALHLACQANNEAIVSLLLDHNAQVSILNSLGQTALHLTAASGNCDIMRRLLATDKSTIDHKANKSGHAALHYASRHGNAEICRILLGHGATKHIPDAVRLPPVKYAKDKDTRRVFEEPTSQPAAPPPVAPPKAPLASAPTPPPKAPPAPKATEPVSSPKPTPNKQPPAPVPAERRSRSKSSDPPREPRAKDPSAQRQKIAAEASKYGEGKLNRNDISIFNESVSRSKEAVGPAIVGKKKEGEVGQVKDKKMTFSDAHKKRMQMSVFDRLAGGSRKK